MKKFLKFIVVFLCSLTLFSCGNGNCPPNNNDSLLLKLVAPSEYPAGVAVTAYLTIYNTSSIDANNLYYSIPAEYNFTGATITVKNGKLEQPCYNIPAHQQCTFPVEISANSHPGSFTVNATQNGIVGTLSKFENSIKSTLGLSSDAISLTANIGLTQVAPNTNAGADGISFLYNKVVSINPDGVTQVAITAIVGSNAGSFNTLNLVDASGNLLNFTTISLNSGSGKSQLVAGSIVTFVLTMPQGVTNLPFYAQTMLDGAIISTSTLSNPLSSTPVSNGILVVQPTSFSFSANNDYTEQMLTYTNIGESGIVGLSFDVLSSPITILENNCGSTLASGTSCTIKLKSNAIAGSSGTGSFVARYTNMPAVVVSQYNYSGSDAVYGIQLSATNNFTFTATTVNSSSSTQVTLTNSGNVLESNFDFSFDSNYFTISSGTGDNSCTISSNKVTNTLSNGDSCSFTLTYTNNQVVSSTSTMTVDFNYNGSHTASDTKTIIYSTTQAVASLNITGNDNFGTIIANNQESQIHVFTVNNVGEDSATSISIEALAVPFTSTNNCGNSLVSGGSCTVTVKFGPTNLSSDYNESIVINYKSSTDLVTIESTTQPIFGTARSPLTANVQISSVIASGNAGGNGESSGSAFMIESTSATAATLTLTYNNISGNYAAQNFNVDTSMLPANYTLVSNGCSNITLQPNSANNCQVVLKLSTTATGNYNIDFTNSLLSSWNDERGAQTSQEIDWNTQSGMKTQIYVQVFPSANVSAILSSSSTGSPVIDSVNIESTFYVVFSLNGGYNVGNKTYTVNTTGGFSPVSSSCVLSSNNPTCSVEFTAPSIPSTGNTITVSGNPTPNPSSFTVDVIDNTPVGCTNCIIFFTNASYNSNLKAGGGSTSSIPGIPAITGTAGADAICQYEANLNNQPVTAGKTFKAMLLSSLRYPCNSSGLCGANGAVNWPIKPLTNYYTPLGTSFATQYELFATSNVNGVFESIGATLYSQTGGTTNGYFWSGINGFRVGSTTGVGALSLLSAWSYANLSNVWPGDWSYYSAWNCSDWESTAGLYSSANCGMAGGLGTNANASSFTTVGLTPESGYDINFAKSLTNPQYKTSTRWAIGTQMGTYPGIHLVCIEQ